MDHKTRPTNKRSMFGLSLAMMVTACSSQSGGDGQGEPQDDHFTCAAIISAADHLVATDRAPADASITQNGLMASMGHLNAWAIPKGLPESEAFDSVKKERERLLGELTQNEIVARAKVCINQMLIK